jgi:hypothetical protein
MEQKTKFLEKDIGFALAEIFTDKFVVHSFSDIPEDADLQHDFSLNFGWAAEVNFLVVRAESCIRYDNHPIVEVAISCGFKLSNTETFIHEKRVIIPVELGRHMAMITYSTSRGVLHAKTEHTPANNFFLPLTNIQSVLTEDIVLEIGRQSDPT